MSSGSWSNRRGPEAAPSTTTTTTNTQSIPRPLPAAASSSVGSGGSAAAAAAVTSTYSTNSSAVSLNLSTKPTSPSSRSATVQQQQQSLQQQARRIFKIIVIGDANVGKTCLTFRFCGGKFLDRSEATIGVDFREKTIQIDDEIIKLQIWDTAGQDRFRKSMIAHYYRNVHAVIFVYDVTNHATFESLPHWIDEYNRNCSSSLNDQTIPKILVGNKCDLNSEMRVNTSAAQTFADMYSMPLFETSAKDDSKQDHVDAIFMTLALKLKNSKPFYVPELHKVKAQTVTASSSSQNNNNNNSERESACFC